jgi:hypothetical protein
MTDDAPLRQLLWTSMKFSIPYQIMALVAAAALTTSIIYFKIAVPTSIDANILLPLTAGMIGVLTALLLAFWGYFWSEVISAKNDLPEIGSIVKIYRRSFGYCVPALALLFVSIGADFYLVLGHRSSKDCIALSLGTFGAALFVLLIFVVAFSCRTLIDMDALLKASEVSSAGAAPDSGTTPVS